MRWIVTVIAIVLAGCGPGTEPEQSATNGGADSGQTQEMGADAGTDMPADDVGGVDIGNPDVGPEPDEGMPATVDTSPLDVMDRPADVFVPDDYDAATSYPLIVMLHGYSANSAIQDFYFGTSQQVTERQYVLITPDGSSNPENKKYWNAYWCCDFYGEQPDDVAYISGLIDAAKQRYSIDDERVYVMGHSNGGFMSYRMACEVEGVTAIMSLAGSGPEEPADCSAGAGNTSILQIHGTSDTTITYDGTVGQYPSARVMMERWAERNGCDPEPTAGEPLDLVRVLAGEETTTESWENCAGGTAVKLWAIQNGSHIPTPNDNFKNGILDFLLSQ